MKQTLKATAAVIGMLAAGLTLNAAINTPLTDSTTEALTAITAICAAGAMLILAGYAINLFVNRQH